MNVSTTSSNLAYEIPTGNWSRSLWFNLAFGFTSALSIFIGIISDAPLTYILGQSFLSFSVYLSFCLLADRPLINPIQSFVAIFYWWFAGCPTVGGGFYLLLNLPDKALIAQTSGMEALWIVAAGLPLYAIAARHTLVLIAQKGFHAHFLLPEGTNFKKKTIMYFFAVGIGAEIILVFLSYIGISGQESLNYLGGVKTTIWWVGVIAGISRIISITNSILVTELVQPWKSIDPSIKILCIVIMFQTIYSALFSGWKGAFVFMFFYIMCAYVSKYQRLPLRSLSLFLLAYLLVIEPFVSTARHLAEVNNVTTSTERKALFANLLHSGAFKETKSIRDINIESPFRGIYVLAGDITRNNDLFSGEWDGYTFAWGLGSLVPRVLNPNKRDMNIGNYFYKTVYSRAYMKEVVSDISNVSITLPFEFVGNYGWTAGVLSFVFIGILWASFCGWLLSVPRLSNHPLAPFLIALTLYVEAPLGHFLSNLRDLFIPLAVIYIIRRFVKGGL